MQTKYSFNENYFETIDSEEKAYWLGFLYADGYVVNNDVDKQYRVCLTLNENDKGHVELFKECLESNNSIRTVCTKLNDKEYFSSQFYIYSKKMVNDLYNNGCVQNKSLILKPPVIIDNLVGHFIRGYFDGDGSIYYDKKRDRYVFSILGTNEVLLWICNKIGIGKHIRNAKKDSLCKEMRVNKKADLIKIYDYVFKDSSIYLERKMLKVNNMYQWSITNKYNKKIETLSSDIINLWNDGKSSHDIYNIVDCGIDTIRRILKNGAEKGLCNYDPINEKLYNKVGKPNLSCSKEVYVYDKDKNFIRKYPSISELCRKSEADFNERFTCSSVSRVCLNKRNHYKNYIFSYVQLLKTERSETSAMADLLD